MQDILCFIANRAADELQTAAHLISILAFIHDLVAQDECLSKKVKWTVKERGGNDKARLAKLFQMKRLDHSTTQVLDENWWRWHQDPESFWRRPATPVGTALQEPQAQVVESYLRTHCDDA